MFEYRNGLTNPSYPYALIETALRAASGRSLEEHQESIGKLYERFSQIASKNPYAWIKKPFSAKQIITPSSENRKICHPYTKYMVSNLYVDQSAALIMTTENIAKKLGINSKLWVYPMSGVDLNNIFFLTQRPHLHDSPAIREASRLVLNKAGLKLEEIDVFDLYSCFPCMVEIARQEIGIPEDDPRDLTITGGLSFFGGNLNRLVARKFSNILVISLEIKKFFMDEDQVIFYEDLFSEFRNEINNVLSHMINDVRKRVRCENES